MKPLIILLIAFVIGALGTRSVCGSFDLRLAGRIAMMVMLVITAIGHFVYYKGMAMMIPGFIPYKKEIVFLTGILELLAGVGLLVTATMRPAGWFLILFFVVLLPANISAALRHVDLQKGTNEGPGPQYLWFRIPLQLLFIGWVYFSAIYQEGTIASIRII